MISLFCKRVFDASCSHPCPTYFLHTAGTRVSNVDTGTAPQMKYM